MLVDKKKSKVIFVKFPNHIIDNNLLGTSEIYEISILLSYRKNTHNFSYPSLDILVRDWGGTMEYHNKIIKQLEEKGLITIRKRKSTNPQFPRNEYVFNFDLNTNFTRVPLDVIKMVNRGVIGKAEYSFFVKLLRRINNRFCNLFNVTISGLSKLLGYSPPTTRKLLDNLDKAWILDVTKHSKKTTMEITVMPQYLDSTFKPKPIKKNFEDWEFGWE